MSENSPQNSKTTETIKSDINICISIINFMVSELETSLSNEKTALNFDEIQSKNKIINIIY
jgi:hypothetical protein